MKTKLALLFCALALPLFAQNTAFTYQGHLNDGAGPASGLYDFTFTLFDSNELVIAGPLTNAATAVTNGSFTATLDFGPAFDGSPRFLEIAVETNGGSGFVTLSPRQPVTPTPLALFAANASNAVTASTAAVASMANSVAATNISGPLLQSQLPSSVVTNGATGVNLSGTITTPTAFSTARIVNKMASGQHVKVLFIGDSMSEAGYNYFSSSLSLSGLLRDWYGDGGQGINPFDVTTGAQCFTRTPPCGFFSGPTLYANDQVRMFQYNIIQSGPGQYYNINRNWPYAFATNVFNKIGFWWLQWPQGGSFNFGATNWNNTFGATLVPTAPFSSYAPAPAVQYVSFAINSSNTMAYWTGVAATNFLIGCELANTNAGCEVFFWSQGGIALTNLYSFGSSLLTQIFSAIAPDFVVFNNKNNGGAEDGSNIPVDYSNLVSCLPSGTPICLTLTPDTPTGYGINDGIDTNVTAFANAGGYGLVDLKRAFPSWQTMLANGLLEPDGIHPTPAGAYQEAQVYCRELNLYPAPTIQMLPYPITSLTQSGAPGQMSISNGAVFICVKSNTWKQVMLSP